MEKELEIVNDFVFSMVLESTKPVVIDFYTDWCGPCKDIEPYLEKLGFELEGKVDFVRVDIEKNPSIANQYGVKSIPTIMIFSNGEVKDFSVGTLAVKDLKEKLLKLIERKEETFKAKSIVK